MEALVCACSRQLRSRLHKDLKRTYMTRLQCIRRLSIYQFLQESKKDKSDNKKVVDKEKSQKTEADTKTEAEPVSAISAKIIAQILSMKISGETAADDVPNVESHLNLAKPVDRRAKRLEEKRAVEEIQREAPGVSVDLIKAAREVASNIGGDVEKTKSELLTKLLQHAGETGSASATGVSDIIAGMRVDRPDKAKGGNVEFGGSRSGETALSSGDPSINMTDLQTPKRFVSKTDLFGAPRLNIFSKEANVDQKTENIGLPVLKTWEMLQKRELDLLVTHPPKNAFEEEIQWLKQGKVWRFPIDNEQGMDDEKRIGFHEHVFLEPLIDDFPKKGPIRHFMELVIVGLSKNPYITVEQKKADIDWFRQYFKERSEVLKEIGAL